MSNQPTPVLPDVPFKLKEARYERQKTPLWMLLGCLGIGAIIITGLMIFVYVTGQTFGLPIGGLFNSKSDLGTLGESPIVKFGTLLSGSRHEYSFVGTGGTPVVVAITFPMADSKAITRAVTLLGPSGETLGSVTLMTLASAPAATIQVVLPRNGQFTIVINGIKGVQGGYTLQAVAAPRSGNPFGNIRP